MESVVVWSSMSSVTVVPAALAASQMRRGVLQRDLLAVARQRLADRGELHRHLGARGQPLLGEPLENREVGVAGRLGLAALDRVLAEVVEAHQPSAADQHTADVDRLLGAGAGHEPGHHAAGDRCGLHDVADAGAARERQQRSAEHERDLLVRGGRTPLSCRAQANAGSVRRLARPPPGASRRPPGAGGCFHRCDLGHVWRCREMACPAGPPAPAEEAR